ncbi:MAG TPA: hypothetical protein VGG26_09060 [Terracidiphilus sp.]
MMQIKCDGTVEADGLVCFKTYPEDGAEDATIFTRAELRAGAKTRGWTHNRSQQTDHCPECTAALQAAKKAGK